MTTTTTETPRRRKAGTHYNRLDEMIEAYAQKTGKHLSSDEIAVIVAGSPRNVRYWRDGTKPFPYACKKLLAIHMGLPVEEYLSPLDQSRSMNVCAQRGAARQRPEAPPVANG